MAASIVSYFMYPTLKMINFHTKVTLLSLRGEILNYFVDVHFYECHISRLLIRNYNLCYVYNSHLSSIIFYIKYITYILCLGRPTLRH